VREGEKDRKKTEIKRHEGKPEKATIYIYVYIYVNQVFYSVYQFIGSENDFNSNTE